MLTFILVLLNASAPLYIATRYFVNIVRLLPIKKNLIGNKSDFWLENKEKQLFKRIDHEIKLTKIGTGNTIRNQKESYEILEKKILKLMLKPYCQWMYFNKLVREHRALKMTFLTWFVIQVFYYFGLNKKSICEVYLTIHFTFKALFGNTSDNHFIYSNISFQENVLSILFTVISYYLYTDLFHFHANNITPKPDKVNINNVDLY